MSTLLEAFNGTQPASRAEEAATQEIVVSELKRWLDDGRDVQLIDVREPHEYAVAQLPNATFIPLGAVVARSAEIDSTRETVVFCKGGARSAKAIAALRQAGFSGRLTNLKGGILAWSKEIDPSVPRY